MRNFLTRFYNFLVTYEFKLNNIRYTDTNLDIGTIDLIKLVFARMMAFLVILPFFLVFLVLSLTIKLIDIISSILDYILYVKLNYMVWEPIDNFKNELGKKIERILL